MLLMDISSWEFFLQSQDYCPIEHSFIGYAHNNILKMKMKFIITSDSSFPVFESSLSSLLLEVVTRRWPQTFGLKHTLMAESRPERDVSVGLMLVMSTRKTCLKQKTKCNSFV